MARSGLFFAKICYKNGTERVLGEPCAGGMRAEGARGGGCTLWGGVCTGPLCDGGGGRPGVGQSRDPGAAPDQMDLAKLLYSLYQGCGGTRLIWAETHVDSDADASACACDADGYNGGAAGITMAVLLTLTMAARQHFGGNVLPHWLNLPHAEADILQVLQAPVPQLRYLPTRLLRRVRY
eukprot:3611251-Rhodomonas_salina.2